MPHWEKREERPLGLPMAWCASRWESRTWKISAKISIRRWRRFEPFLFTFRADGEEPLFCYEISPVLRSVSWFHARTKHSCPRDNLEGRDSSLRSELGFVGRASQVTAESMRSADYRRTQIPALSLAPHPAALPVNGRSGSSAAGILISL